MKKLISVFLVLLLLLTPLSGCGGNNPGGNTSGSEAEATTEAIILTPEKSAAADCGVTVDMGPYALDGEAELHVQKRAAEEQEDYKIESYDITVGELSELSDFITVRIPYDGSYCEAGQDAALCVGAKYLNETTGEWEPVLYEVDAEAKELVIYTDHLSVYGAFHVRNEGQRRAYITDVYADVLSIDQEQAMAALQEYVTNGGEAGEASVGLAANLMAATDFTADAAGTASFGADLAGNLLHFATLGDKSGLSPLAKGLFDKLGNAGKLMAAVKIGAVMLKTDKADEDVLNLYKDTANLALSFVETKALGMAMAALFVFDYTISEMFAQGMAIRRNKINAMYIFFNDRFDARIAEGPDGLYKARDLREWRKTLIEIAENNPDNPAQAIEEEIDRYCNVFWNLDSDGIGFLISEYESKGTVAGASVPEANTNEARQMTEDYKKDLYERLRPVVDSIPVYMQRKAEAEYLAALSDLQKYLNQTITLSFSEELSEGEAPRYAGYVMRFEPLGEGVDATTWTTKALGENGAAGQTRFTLIGYLTAGAPDTLALYKPGDVPGEAVPELTVPFTLAAPVTEVIIGPSVPTFEELAGSYADGMLTVTEVFVSDALRAELSSSDGSATIEGTDINVEGCDLLTVIAALEEQIGVPNSMPFTLIADGENTGRMDFDGDAVDVTYDAKTGLLTVTVVQDGQSMGGGELQCAYSEDGSGVTLSGSLKLLMLPSDEDFYAIATVSGSKPLAAPTP